MNRLAVKLLVGTASRINCGNPVVNTVYQERKDWLVVPDCACVHVITRLCELNLRASTQIPIFGCI